MTFIKTEKINQEIFDINKNTIVEFIKIHNIVNFDEIYIHAGVNKIYSSLVFDNQEYSYVPFELTGVESQGDGGISRPNFKIVNFSGFMSKYLRDKDDLLGAKVTRIRTYLKFLDKVNFLGYDEDPEHWKSQGINPDPISKFRDDDWVISQKIEENKFFISFELTNALDLENITLPNRKIINNYCYWKYRGKGCKYDGDPIADSNNVKFKDKINFQGKWGLGKNYITNDSVYLVVKEGNTTRRVFYVCAQNHSSSNSTKPSLNSDLWVKDDCNKKLGGCKLRYKEGPLPFGGFPSSRLY
jgi:lambda family phage minor tail protein L